MIRYGRYTLVGGAWMDGLIFGREDIENVLAGMSEAEIDRLPFGVIQVDSSGRILLYSATEGAITGRDPEEMIGKDFFTEIAPCGQTDAFYGRFHRGVARGELNEVLDYTFNYQMRPTRVRIHMKRAMTDDTYWIFVKRIHPR